MTSVQAQQTVGALPPHQIKSALLGVAFKDADTTTLAYFDFLADILAIDSVRFVHYLPDLYMYSNYYTLAELGILHPEERIKSAATGVFKLIENNIDTTKFKDWQVDVNIGSAITELLKAVEENQTDLAFIGKSTHDRFHGISARRFARLTPSNVLVVPDQATPPQLRHILVPFDFSSKSKAALRTAITLQQLTGPEVEIRCLNVYEVPPVNWYVIQRTEEEMAKMMRQDREEAFARFMAEEYPTAKDSVRFEAVRQELSSIGRQVMRYVNQSETDLIIMGANSHSALERFFLGSVSEKVIDLTERVPVWVMKAE